MNTRPCLRGCLLGLALGDAFGAPHEGGLPERLVWSLIGRSHGRRRFTDDTQMTIDVAESLLARGTVDLDDIARRFADSYRWSRGYGAGAARLLKRVRGEQPWREARTAIHAQGSFGNGGAMRSPLIGALFAGQPELEERAREIASITHVHPLGLEGARLIACATAWMSRDMGDMELLERLQEGCSSQPFHEKLSRARQLLERPRGLTARELADSLGNGVAALDSCVTAIVLALWSRLESFEVLHARAVEIGGDVDTIAAMAGGAWGALRGAEALPGGWLDELEERERLESLAEALGSWKSGLQTEVGR